jgi:hypothetical protein
MNATGATEPSCTSLELMSMPAEMMSNMPSPFDQTLRREEDDDGGFQG